ncbi:MAG: mechanosensitive ion channel family protein [Candidatus Nanohaloarchaea archaeon]|nr:mechanosensitive ion channel family protein [Candidatus Nanohaloarchaea archaeon]
MVLLEVLPGWAVGPVMLVAVVIGSYLAGRAIVKPVAYRLLQRKSEHLARPLSRVTLYLTVIIGLIAGLTTAGYGNTLGVLGAVLAAGTFALGFGMQDTLKALIAGVFIFIDKPFEIGDWIEWDGNEGRVEDIHLRTTKIETFDNELITVPNDQIANTTVTNNTANDRIRRKLTVGIGYEDDIENAKYIINNVLQEIDAVMDNPAPEIVLESLGDSAVNIQVFYWIGEPRKARLRNVKEQLLEEIKHRFDEEGIDFPFPTRTIAGDSLSLEE